MRSPCRSPLVCLGYLSFLFVAGSAAAQVRTVLVSPVPGNPAASGTALRNALAGISTPSSTNRWLVKIEPGIYDIGTTSLPMRPWVDVEGSGIDTTTIQGNVDGSSLNAGTVNGASNAELRLLTVAANGTRGRDVIGVYNENVVAMRLYRVKIQSVGIDGNAWGMRSFASAPLIEECELKVTTSGFVAYGLVFSAFVPTGERSSLLRSSVAVWGADQNYGVYMRRAQTLTVVRDSRIDVTGGSLTWGLYAVAESFTFWDGDETLHLRDSEISSGGGGAASYGAWFEGNTSVGLDVQSAKIAAHTAPNTSAIKQDDVRALVFQGASLVGGTALIHSAGPVSIASTALIGGEINVSNWVGCMGVWDENAVFYANSCP